MLGTYRDQGKRDLTLAIGGADGLDPSLYDKADATICLGKMTWPHQLVRILIAEQLYRAVTIHPGIPTIGLDVPLPDRNTRKQFGFRVFCVNGTLTQACFDSAAKLMMLFWVIAANRLDFHAM